MRVVVVLFALWVNVIASDVVVNLKSSWAHSSLIAETSEFFRERSSVEFWQFVDDIVEKSPISLASAEKEYNIALKGAEGVTTESAMDILKLSLSLRAFSPAVVAFQQMGTQISGVESCAVFFDVHGNSGCSVEALVTAVDTADSSKKPDILTMDTLYSKENFPVTIIIYGKLGSLEMKEMHDASKRLVVEGRANYVFRHFDRNPATAVVSLSSYGVELAIKNTEYKVQDDSDKKKDEVVEDEDDLQGLNMKLLKQLYPNNKDSLEQLQIHLRESQELAPLKQWEVQDLGFQAAQKIVSEQAENAISALKDISQNFPLHARTLARQSVNAGTRKEIEKNQASGFSDIDISPGDTALFLNGIKLDIDDLDMFQLTDILKQEEKLSTGFFNMGFKREYLSILTSLDLSNEKTSYGVDYREAYPFYLNNLDSDKKYRQWGNSVKLMLQPYYPGMIRPIARNLFTLIFVVNPTEKESRNLMKIAHSFYAHDLPLRIGVVFAVDPDTSKSGLNDAGIAVLNLFNYVTIDSTVEIALKTVNKLFDSLANRIELSTEDVHKYFTKNFRDVEINDVFGADSDYNKGRKEGANFLERSAIGKAPKVLLNGHLLDDAGLTGDRFEETVMVEVMRASPKIQRAVMDGTLKDRVNVQNWLIVQPDIMPRLNTKILATPTGSDYLDLTDMERCKIRLVTEFEDLSAAQKTQCIVEKLKYVTKSDEQSTKASTIWIVADLETPSGRNLAYSALKHLKKSPTVRVAFLYNPTDLNAASQLDSTTARVHAAIRLLPNNQAKQLITKLVKEENIGASLELLAVGGMNLETFEKNRKVMSTKDHLKMHSIFLRDVAGISSGRSAFIANGLVSPLEDQEKLNEEDFALLEKVLIARGAKVVASHVDKWEVEKDNGKSSNVVLRSVSLIGRHATPQKRTWVVLNGDEHSSITLNADDGTRASMDVVAIIDPLSRSAQKLAPILELLRKGINCDMKIVMNPKPKLSELPLKRFFRYVIAPELQFDGSGHLIKHQAQFSQLPSKQLLTMSVHPPDAWMIEAVEAEYDLDNIQMEQVKGDVIAIFALQNILLEGHCFDEISGSPPRGLQFILGTPDKPEQYDTIVMANLGYFQLKANPGSWLLKLREGRSSEIYKVVSHTNTDGEVADSVRVLMNSFTGRTIRVRVAKREGMEDENVLSDGSEENGIWNTLNSLVGEKHETINVFSLASGHLYERFMRIMILSVMKQTKSPVRFWLLKNYLSPQFKKQLPLMAQEYGFDYKLVEYKWPRWLHQQKEKHRIMWGYKILFLDVLFPLDLQKIIFVDADQVVRSDLYELMNYGLDGAPYGYVPFCDSRTEMDGFRFWKQGYWKNHLAGRKYHISALYVVDLNKFRQLAAGDRLRGQYQGLSADPNSLSNLDQDLPNNMIHQVRIKSLPQEWLWCETWCNDSSKSAAKTIDLCNNPLTKEPKLDSAQRIIPEWKDYDKEIKDVLARRSAGLNEKVPPADKHSEL